MDELQIIYLATNELTPYEGNARHHSHDDIESIKASIREFGFCDPIGVWGKKNIIVEGHGRLIAAEELGLTEIPCIRLDDLTEGQRRAYALAHNKTAELSNWDFSKLEEELAHLSLDFDMTQFGFSEQTGPAPLDLDEPDGDQVEQDEGNNKQLCHCPKCGFIFEI